MKTKTDKQPNNSPIKYKFGEFFRKWGFSSIKLTAGFAEIEFSPQEDDQTAAWELYVELLTRVATQPIPDIHGNEEAALDSIYHIFGITRDILRNRGRGAKNFTKISVIVLNQVIRPFTAKWHSEKISGAFKDLEKCKEFRLELRQLQKQLIQYTRMLAELAMVEDLTDIVEISSASKDGM